MKARLAVGIVCVVFLACGGQVSSGGVTGAGGPQTNADDAGGGGSGVVTTVSTIEDGGSPTSAAADDDGGAGPNHVDPNIGDQFSALAYSPTEHALYVAESFGAPAVGTPTIWRIDAQGNKTQFLSSADIGHAIALAVRVGANGIEVLWLAATDPDQPPFDTIQVPTALRSSTGGAVTTLMTNVVGTMIALDGSDAWVQTTDNCIALVGSTPLRCIGGDIYGFINGGNGFRIVNGVLYSAGKTALHVTDLSSGITTDYGSSNTTCNQPAHCTFDLSIAGAGVYMTGSDGDSIESNGSLTPGGEGFLQIEVVGSTVYTLTGSEIATLPIDQFTAIDPQKAATLVSKDEQQFVRFVVSDTTLYWVSGDGSRVLSAPL